MKRQTISIGKRGRKRANIKRGVFPQGSFDNEHRLLEVARNMAMRDGLSTVIKRINLVAIWNKNKNPSKTEMCKHVISILKQESLLEVA